MPLNAVSRPPPHLLSTFITASAAKHHPGCDCEALIGLRDTNVPAGLIQLVTPPKYWKPITHWGYSLSYCGKVGRFGQVQICPGALLTLRPRRLASRSSGGFRQICTTPKRAGSTLSLLSSAYTNMAMPIWRRLL